MQIISAAKAIQLLHTTDTITLGFGPAFPIPFMEALGDRDDWQELTIYAAILPAYYDGLSHPKITLRSLFFGPVERHMQAIGADIHYIPADLRRQALFAKKNPTRVFVCAVSPPDNDGYVSLSANATQYENIVACSQDPKRLLIFITTNQLPSTMGYLPDYPHRIHLDDVDFIINEDFSPPMVDDVPLGALETALAHNIRPFIPDRATLQTGFGSIPGAVVKALSQGANGNYGIHSEMFTNGLMHLCKTGKVSNEYKGIFTGISVCAFAMGSAELYEWLHENEQVRFMPPKCINSPAIIAENINMRSINGALMLDLAGQIVADTIDGRQYSGIGGHEDFTSGASMGDDDRSIICLPATVTLNGQLTSRITAQLTAGSIITTPRHQLDIVVTEFGAAEVAGLTTKERAHALAEIAHPQFRDPLHEHAEQTESM
ncbi:MAG: acetyl-CoA hydrolase/transferase C-terminal domain-containing protein [Halioglobus sp.]|nr:acetyl-CoA hydrolase/transferase C-terminal domain-containing protein [Halioglobus sp.]